MRLVDESELAQFNLLQWRCPDGQRLIPSAGLLARGLGHTFHYKDTAALTTALTLALQQKRNLHESLVSPVLAWVTARAEQYGPDFQNRAEEVFRQALEPRRKIGDRESCPAEFQKLLQDVGECEKLFAIVHPDLARHPKGKLVLQVILDRVDSSHDQNPEFILAAGGSDAAKALLNGIFLHMIASSANDCDPTHTWKRLSTSGSVKIFSIPTLLGAFPGIVLDPHLPDRARGYSIFIVPDCEPSMCAMPRGAVANWLDLIYAPFLSNQLEARAVSCEP